MTGKDALRILGVALGAAAVGGAMVIGARPIDGACLGRFETSMEERTDNQRHNARLAMLKIDGVLIKPGETFSFNQTVGTYSRDQGYRRAPVSYNGQLAKGWGGGVCQTSTTLYNAALLSGMKIVERSRHRFAPSYAPPGRDAAVAFHTIDLKFSNPYDFPVRIKTSMSRTSLDVGIYGARKPSEMPHIVTKIESNGKPATIRLTPAGERGRVRNTGKDGFEAVVYREWTGRREFVSRDTYPVMHRVVEFEGD